jgi:hypothetical protein
MNYRYKSAVDRVAFALATLVFFVIANTATAQSIDPNSPSPVRSSNLTGKILARDLGDSRLTDHYYKFRGLPGDLLVTVQSKNLNGDIDVFTAGTLRPLLKLTLYAESTSPVTKGIFLRRAEDLILRVEARSPNDDEGTYQFFFGGTFQPIEGGLDVAESDIPSAPTTDVPNTARKTKRVSSVGARIEEPAPPVTEVATATPTPDPTPEPSPIESVTPSTSSKPLKVEAPKPAPRTTRNRRPAPRRNTTIAAKPKETPTEEVKTEPAETESAPKPKPPARAPRRGTPPVAQPEPEPETGPRLIIETNDGTLINRSMSNVRRVTVENGQVVVVGKDGKIDRIRLVNVVKMAIQP